MLAIWQLSWGMRFAMLWSICLLKQRSRSGAVGCFRGNCDPLFFWCSSVYPSEESWKPSFFLSDCMFVFKVSELQPCTMSYYFGCRENILLKHVDSWGVLVTWGQTISFCSVGAGIIESWMVIQLSMFIAWGFEVHIEGGLFIENNIRFYTHKGKNIWYPWDGTRAV